MFLTLFTIIKHRLKFRNTTKMWMKRKVGSFRRGWNWLNEFLHWEKEKYSNVEEGGGWRLQKGMEVAQ